MAQAFASVELSGDAVEVLRAAVRIDERRAGVQRLLAQLLDANGDPAAVEHYWQAVRLDVGEANYGLAREGLKRILELSPEDPEALKLLKSLPAAPRQRPS